MSTCHVICWKQNKASISPCKEEEILFFHTKSPKQALQTVSLSFPFCLAKHFHVLPDIFQVICSIRTTSYEAG